MAALVVQLMLVAANLGGLFDFVEDDYLGACFRSKPSPPGECPSVVFWREPPSGSRFFMDADELDRLLDGLGPGARVLVNVPRRRIRGTPPPCDYRPENAPPLAHSEELLRLVPPLTDHLRALFERLRADGAVPPAPWWAVSPLVEERPLLDASLIRWVPTVSLDRLLEEDGAAGRWRGHVVVLGGRDAKGGPLTYCGQVSESLLCAMIVAEELSGDRVYPGGRLFDLLCMLFVTGTLSLACMYRGRRWSVALSVLLVLAAPHVSASLMWPLGFRARPFPWQSAALATALLPLVRGGKAQTRAERRRMILEELRRAYEDSRARIEKGLEQDRAAGETALSGLVDALERLDGASAAAWRAVLEQDELKDEGTVELESLELHALEVEELYALGRSLERGYHWNEALVAYDWGVLKRMDYLDIRERRNEAKEAVAGNLEFIDIDELTERLDKRYKGMKLLGQGGMGVVLAGEDSYLERPVALKLVMPSALADRVARERFLREIETLGALNHPLVVQVYNVHRDDELLYYTMELLDGKGLREAVGPSSDMPFGRRLQVLADLAGVLAFIHGKGIVHRDLKPDNVLYVEGRGPVLIDFGIARTAEQEDGLTQAGQLLGTLAYMAPELVSPSPSRGDDLEPARRADIFAFGVILYEMFTGTLPFTNPLTLKARPPKGPDELCPGLPGELAELITSCMAVDPSARPPGFGRVEVLLRRLGEGEINR